MWNSINYKNRKYKKVRLMLSIVGSAGPVFAEIKAKLTNGLALPDK